MSKPRYKIMLEGIQVPASRIVRSQTEGEPTRLTLDIWPTAKGSRIARGTYITIFRWESDQTVLAKLDKDWDDLTTKPKGAWLLFFDGFVNRKPMISRRERNSLQLQCVAWSARLDKVFLRAQNIGKVDIGLPRDQAFLGINVQTDLVGPAEINTPYFYPETAPGEAMLMIKNSMAISDDGVAGGLLDLVKYAVNYDLLYARVAAVIEMNKRFFAVDNPLVKEMITVRNVSDVMQRQIDAMPSTSSLLQMINSLMLQMFFTSVSVPSPKIDDDGLHQFIYKPQLFFSVPMKCNIIFPTSVEYMEPTNAGYDQATRLAFVGSDRQIGTNDVYTSKVFFPDELGDLFDKVVLAGYDQIDFAEKYTEEELLEERISPQFSAMPFSDSTLNADELDKGERGLSKVYGRYSYFLDKYNVDPLSVTMHFDPWLVCGFSAYIIDDKFGYILGRLRTITDVIDLQQNTSKTIVELVNIRIVDDSDAAEAFQVPDYDKLFGIELDSSDGAFFDESLNNDGIDESLYVPQFGCQSIINGDDEYYKDGTNTVEGAAKIRNAIIDIKARHGAVPGEYMQKFMDNFKHRPVATEGEYMKFLGAKVNDEDIDDRYFSSKKYDAGYKSTDPGKFTGYNSGTVTAMVPFMEERQAFVSAYVEGIRDNHLADRA